MISNQQCTYSRKDHTMIGAKTVTTAVQTAFMLAIAVVAITDYLKRPLTNTPRIAAWMEKVGLAYAKDSEKPALGDNLTVWCIPYITFAFGFTLSYAFQVDIVSVIIGEINPLASILLTSAIIGGGSNIISQVSNIGKR